MVPRALELNTSVAPSALLNVSVTPPVYSAPATAVSLLPARVRVRVSVGIRVRVYSRARVRVRVRVRFG